MLKYFHSSGYNAKIMLGDEEQVFPEWALSARADYVDATNGEEAGLGKHHFVKVKASVVITCLFQGEPLRLMQGRMLCENQTEGLVFDGNVYCQSQKPDEAIFQTEDPGIGAVAEWFEELPKDIVT